MHRGHRTSYSVECGMRRRYKEQVKVVKNSSIYVFND